MPRLHRSTGAASSLLACLLAGGALAETPADATIRVRVYDHAKLSGVTVASATSRASMILRKAGIASEWLVGETAGTASALPADAASENLVITLVGETPPFYRTGSAMGYAAIQQDGGTFACIFWDRVVRNADQARQRRSQVLGMAIAHEIGHLLGNDHAPRGIMKAHIGAAELRRAVRGQLYFQGEESESMRANLRRRAAVAHRERSWETETRVATNESTASGLLVRVSKAGLP